MILITVIIDSIKSKRMGAEGRRSTTTSSLRET